MNNIFDERFREKYIPNMKKIREVFKKDFQEVFNNRLITSIIIALLVFPSLYAWFNIGAFWDPYGNTKNLSVAIVNEDRDYEYKNQKLNFGNEVVKNLKENKSLDWNFVDYKRAKDGLNTGRYYAILTIPKDFTQSLLSLTQVDVKKASIIYTTNEKTNAIAEKITDQGANKLKSKISNQLIQLVTKTSLETLGSISNMTEDINPKLDQMKESLNRLDSQLLNSKKISANNKTLLKDLDRSLETTRTSLNSIKKSLDDTRKINDDLSDMSLDIRSNIQARGPSIKSSLEDSRNILEGASILAQSLDSLGDKGVQDSLASIDKIKDKLDQLASRLDSIRQAVGNFNQLSRAEDRLNRQYNSLRDTSSRLKDIRDQLVSTNKFTNHMSQDIINSLNYTSRGLNDLILDFDDLITKPLNRLDKSSSTINGDVKTLLESTNRLYPSVNNFINDASSLNSRVATSIGVFESSVDILRGQIADSIKLIDRIQNNKDLKAFNKVIKSNILARADFIKSPVEIKEEKIYKMANYGSSMTPFYSVLAAWVGVIVLSTILSTEPSKDYRSIDRYFARLSFFLVLSLVQSLIISLGDLFLLGVTAKEPGLFIFILALCSATFCVLIFTLVSCFKTLGKGIAMFLLVIQIGGSGGTFPIQMTPSFFRAINAIIPFTYAINACREAIGGVYLKNLLADVKSLLVFAIIALIFGVFFKEKINNKLSPLSEKFEESFLIH